LGEHLLRKRIRSGKFQREVASELGVNTWTYLLWEKDRSKPLPRYFPGIFAFLGYDPFPQPQTLGQRLERKRLRMGLSYEEAARLVGVDERTFMRWVSGEWAPRKATGAAESFLRLPLP
jgi:DNA-binding XRE family transcriptional regulator